MAGDSAVRRTAATGAATVQWRWGNDKETVVPVNVLVVDDDPSTRALLRVRLHLDERTECAGEAVNGRQAVEMAALLQPDVVILDVDMPVASGLAALPQIRAVAPRTRVIIFAGATNTVQVDAADAVFVKSGDVLPNLLDAVAALGAAAL